MTVSSQVSIAVRARHKIALARAGLLSLIMLGGIAVFGMAGYRLNLTPSEPVGLWRIIHLDRPIRVGDLVFVCPPPTDIMQMAYERGYLRRGLCEGGLAPLIKTIAATTGQRIGIDSDVRIDGAKLAHSKLRPTDGSGRQLLPFAGGVVPSNAVFLHSDYPASFDSRYFGPVPAANVIGLAAKVWTYEP